MPICLPIGPNIAHLQMYLFSHWLTRNLLLDINSEKKNCYLTTNIYVTPLTDIILLVNRYSQLSCYQLETKSFTIFKTQTSTATFRELVVLQSRKLIESLIITVALLDKTSFRVY